MTLLSDADIRAAYLKGELTIEPYNATSVEPASYDVRLGAYFRVFDNSVYTHIDPKVEHPTKLVEVVPGQPFVLHPGEFALGATTERLTLGTTLAARLEGKSSLARLGLLAHATAGFIDPGFSGQITLELSNVANLPIMLWPGMKIGQLCFQPMLTPATIPYGALRGSHYQGQTGPVASRAYAQF